MVVMLAHNWLELIGGALCRGVRARYGGGNRLFGSPSMEKCSTLRRAIVPVTTTTHGSLDQIPTTDFPRRHRTDGRPPWSTTRRRSGTSFRWWTLRPDTSNRTHSLPLVARSSNQHSFGRMPGRIEGGRSVLLAKVITVNRDHAGSTQGAPANPRPVMSCDSASSGAGEVRAATSRPRSGGSGLDAPLRGHHRGRAHGRWPRGAPVRLARPAG
jgi:hypothetical protein